MFPDDSLTLHTDLYQINMMQVYFNEGIHNKRAVFEVYFRKNPFNNGYAVFAGLERIVAYLNDLKFSQTDLDYLASLGYNGAFLEYLRDFKIWFLPMSRLFRSKGRWLNVSWWKQRF